MKTRAQKSLNTSKAPEEELEPDHSKRIPNELLCKIFRHACHGATTVTVTLPGASVSLNDTYALPTPVALTQVNRCWRAVATNYRRLWADVSGEVSGLWTPLYIKRSGEHPLKLQIWPWAIRNFEETMAAITQAIGRTTDLHILSNFVYSRSNHSAPDVKDFREIRLLSALCECRSDALKLFYLSAYPEPHVLQHPVHHPHACFIVPGGCLSLGAPNLKEVIVDAPFYLPPRHTLLLYPSEHMLGLYNIPEEAFIKMIYHSPTTSKVSDLICTMNWQPFLPDLDPEPEPAHDVVLRDQTPTVANVDLFSVQRLPIDMLHRLTVSPFFQSSSFKTIKLTACSHTYSPTLNQEHADALSLLFQRAADLLPVEYVSVKLIQSFLDQETVSIECGRLGTAADADNADATTLYRTPEEDNVPFLFAFKWPVWRAAPQWAPSMWRTMWPAEMPTPCHLRLARDMIDVPFTDDELPGHLTTIWLQTAARFPDVTMLSLVDPTYDALELLKWPTTPGDAHSLPFPLLETLIVTWVPMPINQNTSLRIQPLHYLLAIWSALRYRHLAHFPPLHRLVLANFGSPPPLFMNDAINLAYVEQIVMT